MSPFVGYKKQRSTDVSKFEVHTFLKLCCFSFSAVLFVIPPFSPQFLLHSMWLLLVSRIFVRQT